MLTTLIALLTSELFPLRKIFHTNTKTKAENQHKCGGISVTCLTI